MRLSYLAVPYTNPLAPVQRARKDLADLFAARLARKTAVFSPISHGTQLERHLPPSLVRSHSFWMEQCIPMLRVATDLYVLPIDGWRESKGVQIEMNLAKQLMMPIVIIQAHDHDLEVIQAEELRVTGWKVEWFDAPTPRGANSHKGAR